MTAAAASPQSRAVTAVPARHRRHSRPSPSPPAQPAQATRPWQAAITVGGKCSLEITLSAGARSVFQGNRAVPIMV